MYIENDLIRASFTEDGKTAEGYMALAAAAAAAGTGELTGRKCKTYTWQQEQFRSFDLSWLKNVTLTCRT